MKTRLHKVLQSKTANLFNHVQCDGKALGCVNVATDRTNQKWPDYEEVCVETYGLDLGASPQHDIHELLVLRGHVRCCCGGACPYPGDHDLTQGGAASKIARVQSIDAPKNVNHPPGQDYSEATMHYNDLAPVRAEIVQRLAAGTVAGFVKEITDESTPLTLSADDIESQLGFLNVDTNGLLSAPGATAAVLAGTSTNPDDYLWVFAFVVLFQRFIGYAHNKLSRDWPGRSQMTSHMFQPKA